MALALAEPPAGTDEEQKNCGHISLGKSAEHRIWMCAGASDKDLHTLIKEEMKRDAYGLLQHRWDTPAIGLDIGGHVGTTVP